MDMVKFLEKMLEEAKNEEKVATGSMSAQRLHGIGGLFSGPGLDQVVFSTFVRPKSVLNDMPLIPSVIEDPRFPALTGFTAPDGAQPTNACDDAPTGFTKTCTLTALFGLHRFDTQEIEMDQVMRRANRGDFGDLRLVGGPILDGLAPSGINEGNVLNVITAMEMMRTSAYMEMQLHIDAWQGTVAGGSFPGLMYQIATGQVDAATNTACPSLDSDIKDFTHNDVCGTGKDIVEYLSAMMYYLESLASDTGLAPVDFRLAMRPQLWFELSACWPCSYLTNRCTTAQVGYNAAVINDNTNVAMRDEMRAGQYLWINGQKYPVILDTGIVEQTNTDNGLIPSGAFASSIFILPFSVIGNFPTLYREYIDYRKAAPDEALLRGLEGWFHTDGGAYSWAYDAIRWCYQLALKTEQRVVLRTPHLAGALQNVVYSPLQHLREPNFSSPYHVDGGVSLPTPGTRYSVWDGSGFDGR
jgi:hypothetical protein